MEKKKRNRALVAFRKIGERIIRLTENDCNGAPTVFLSFSEKGINKVLDDISGADGVHINEVAQFFGVTTNTIKAWLRQNDLPSPLSKQDQERVFIPHKDFNTLVELKRKK